ncbi:hypothetical protein [Neisseria sp.]
MAKGRLKPIAWALPKNFRQPLLADIIVGKAHATMHINGENRDVGRILVSDKKTFDASIVSEMTLLEMSDSRIQPAAEKP